jgi:hypothetical protein
MRGERIQTVARDERLARRAGFAWGLAEGVVFFIVPDVYVSFAALFALRAGAVAWAASIAGSLAGVCCIYLLAAVLGLDYLSFLERIPGVSAGMLASVDRTLRSGLPYTPWLITGGIPLKVYAGVALSQAIGLSALLLWTVFARVVRIAPTFALVAATRLVFRRSIDARPLAWFLLLGVIWVVFYLFYFLAMSRRIWI